MTQTFFLSPSLLFCDEGKCLHITELGSGLSLSFDGELRHTIMTNPAVAARRLEALANLNPDLRILATALGSSRPEVLNRAKLLKGSNYGVLFVELTGRCNEACVHCYAESSPQRTELLPRHIVESVVRDAASLGFRTIQFTGGDPLLSPFLPGAAKQARDLGIPHIEIFTNGLALGGTLYEELKEASVSFAFSFYSNRPEVHDSITRTRGSQARTAAAIRRVLSDGLAARVGVIGMEENKDDIPATVSFLRELGLPDEAIGISFQRKVGRGEFTENTASQEATPSSDRTHSAPLLHPFEGKAAVAYDGAVYPCIFSRSIPLGNIYENSLKEILESPVPLATGRLPGDCDHVRWYSELSCRECRVRAALLSDSDATDTADCGCSEVPA